MKLGTAGNLASIASFGLTVWVLIDVRRLHESYLRRIRLPGLIARLTALSTRLSRTIGTSDDKEVAIVLELLVANLKSMSDRLPLGARGQTKALIKLLSTLRTPTADDHKITVYAKLQGVLEQAKQVKLDQQGSAK